MDFVERGCFVLSLSPLADITDGLVAVVLQWASAAFINLATTARKTAIR